MRRLTLCLLAPLLLLAACSAARSPAATPMPTPTIERTATEPRPTATRTPVPPPPPTVRSGPLDPKTAPYLDAVAGETQTVDDSVQQFIALVTNPMLSDPAWRKQVVLSLVPWSVAYQSAQKLDPPACLAASNQTYLGALAALDTAGKDATQSLADQSQIELDAARLEVLETLLSLQQAANQAQATLC